MLESGKYNNDIFHSFAILLFFQWYKNAPQMPTSLWKYSRFSFSNITKYLVIAFYLPGVLWSFFKLKFELSLFVRWDYLSFMSFLLNTSLFGKENAGKSWKFCDFQHTSLFLQIFTLYSLLFIASCSLPTVYNFLYSCLKKHCHPVRYQK